MINFQREVSPFQYVECVHVQPFASTYLSVCKNPLEILQASPKDTKDIREEMDQYNINVELNNWKPEFTSKMITGVEEQKQKEFQNTRPMQLLHFIYQCCACTSVTAHNSSLFKPIHTFSSFFILEMATLIYFTKEQKKRLKMKKRYEGRRH